MSVYLIANCLLFHTEKPHSAVPSASVVCVDKLLAGQLMLMRVQLRKVVKHEHFLSPLS